MAAVLDMARNRGMLKGDEEVTAGPRTPKVLACTRTTKEVVAARSPHSIWTTMMNTGVR